LALYRVHGHLHGHLRGHFGNPASVNDFETVAHEI
jgi:hypothetical protein